MAKHYITKTSTARKTLTQDYESMLGDISTELSESECKYLADIAKIGYEHALQKDDYIEAVHDTVCEWVAETRRAKLYLTHDSMGNDFASWYNGTGEVESKMKSHQDHSVIPTFFVCFGAVALALFCISATVFVIGLCQNAFPFNPVYLVMFTIGFLGLLMTDVVAIAEWRKGQDVQ